MESVQFGLKGSFHLARHAVDEKDTLEMIVFVLNGAREQTATPEFHGLSVLIRGPNFGGFRAGDVSIDFWKAQATFCAGYDGAEWGDVRIHQDHRHVLIGVYGLAVDLEGGGTIFDIANIEDGELQSMTHLLGGEPNAGGRLHGVKHVRDELMNIRSDLPDFGTFSSEDGRTVIANGQLHRSGVSADEGTMLEGPTLKVILHRARRVVVGRVL